MSRMQKENKEKKCRCGKGATKSLQNCQKTRCPCYLNGWSCSDEPLCLCNNCANPNGTKTSSIKDCNTNTRNSSTRTSTAGKIPHLSSHVFYKNLGVSEKQSVWSIEETLLLFLCFRFLGTSESGQMQRIHALYEQSVQMLFNESIRHKSVSQIRGKCRHMSKYSGIYKT